MKKCIFLLTLLIYTQIFADDFSANTETCTISSTQNIIFKTSGYELNTKVQMDFTFTNPELLPKIRLSFLQHTPQQVNIYWSAIVYDIGNKSLFTPALRELLKVEDNKPFSMALSSSSGGIPVFETGPLDINRAQNLTALFLSQNKIQVNVVTDQGLSWVGELSLNLSEASYKTMVRFCYPQKTESYLTSSGELIPQESTTSSDVTPYAVAVSEGYGMTHFSKILELLPQTAQTLDANTVFTNPQVLDLLNQKKSVISGFAVLANDPVVLKSQSELESALKEQGDLNKELLFLVGDAKTNNIGLIRSQEEKISGLQKNIIDLSAQIDSAKELQSSTSKNMTDLTSQLAPFDPQIEVFKNSQISLEKKRTELEALQKKIEADFSIFKNILSQKSDDLKSQEATTNVAPWNLETIEGKKQESLRGLENYRLLQKLFVTMPDLEQQLTALVAQATSLQSSTENYLQSVSQHHQLKVKLEGLNEQIQEYQKVPAIAAEDDITFILMNQALEAELSIAVPVRDYESEAIFHENLYAQKETDFIRFLANGKDQGAPVFARLVCSPRVLSFPEEKTSPCLFPTELLDETQRTVFLKQLPPEVLDNLLNTLNSSFTKPWNQNTSKTVLINSAIAAEIQNTPFPNSIESQWRSLRHLIWRWVTLEKKASALNVCTSTEQQQLFANSLFSQSFYEAVFECEKQTLTDLDAEKSNTVQLMLESSLKVADMQTSYSQSENLFQTQFLNFSKNLDTTLSSQQELSELSTYFTNCLLPDQRIEVCKTAVFVVIEKSNAFVNSAKDLAWQLSLKINEKKLELAAIEQDLKNVFSEKEIFYQANNIHALYLELESKKQVLANAEKSLSLLSNTFEQQQKDIETAEAEKSELVKKEHALIGQLSAMTLKIKRIENANKQFCESVLKLKSDIKGIDEQVNLMLGMTTLENSPADCTIPKEWLH